MFVCVCVCVIECWLVVGTTGTGKTSLINLFLETNEGQVGTTANSSTKETTFYNHKSNPNVSIVDTCGFSDSDGIDDRETFKNILIFLNEKSITKIKVIWCVEPSLRYNVIFLSLFFLRIFAMYSATSKSNQPKKNTHIHTHMPMQTCRAKSDLKEQANFINDFKNGEIWKSTIAIVKKGDPMEDKDIQGVIKAANDASANNHFTQNSCFRVTCLEWLSPKKFEKHCKRSKEDRQELIAFFFAHFHI